MGIFWWPKSFGPAWYRTWRLPEGKRRRRLEKNIENCRSYSAQATD